MKEKSVTNKHAHMHRDEPWCCILTSGAEQGHVRNIEPPAECNKRSPRVSLTTLLLRPHAVFACLADC